MDSDSSTLELVGQREDGSGAPLLGEQGTACISDTADRAPSEAYSELSDLAREGTRLLDAMQDSDASQMVSKPSSRHMHSHLVICAAAAHAPATHRLNGAS